MITHLGELKHEIKTPCLSGNWARKLKELPFWQSAHCLLTAPAQSSIRFCLSELFYLLISLFSFKLFIYVSLLKLIYIYMNHTILITTLKLA